MRIVKKVLEPSKADAVRLTRDEKMGMIMLAYVATVAEDLKKDIWKRLEMIDNGAERLNTITELLNGLMKDLRPTMPLNQRMNLSNTMEDYEVRLTPKATPSKTTVVMQKEEFRELVDKARVACRECSETDEDCEKCELYQLLTVILPLEDYHYGLLCPYNLGEWGN